MKIRKEFIKDLTLNEMGKEYDGFIEIFERLIDESNNIFEDKHSNDVINGTIHFCAYILAIAAHAKAFGDAPLEDFIATMSSTLGKQILYNYQAMEEDQVFKDINLLSQS